MRIPQLLTLFAIGLALIGCGRQAPKGDTNAGGSKTDDGRPSVAAFISVNMQRVSLSDFVDSVSSLYPHRAVVWVTNSKPGAVYQVSAELFDAAGKSVLKKSQAFNAPEPAWYMVFDYQPPETLPKAGDWKWKVGVTGIGSAEKNFEMLAPTSAQQADQARHQKAREGVLFAFAHSWVAADDFGVPCFFTSITNGQTTADGKPQSIGILEVAGLTGSFSHERVTRADLFNGITYRGSAVFSFDVYRFWSEGAWENWQDVERHGNALGNAFAQLRTDLRRFFPQGVPNEARNFLEVLQKSGFNLVFEITERDGHWFINSNSGAQWIDQRLTKGGEFPKNAAPRYGFIEAQKKDADSPRRILLKETDELLKKNKGGAPQDRPDILKTMKSVRDSSL